MSFLLINLTYTVNSQSGSTVYGIFSVSQYSFLILYEFICFFYVIRVHHLLHSAEISVGCEYEGTDSIQAAIYGRDEKIISLHEGNLHAAGRDRRGKVLFLCIFFSCFFTSRRGSFLCFFNFPPFLQYLSLLLFADLSICCCFFPLFIIQRE